jgi:hypothetical protein
MGTQKVVREGLRLEAIQVLGRAPPSFVFVELEDVIPGRRDRVHDREANLLPRLSRNGFAGPALDRASAQERADGGGGGKGERTQEKREQQQHALRQRALLPDLAAAGAVDEIRGGAVVAEERPVDHRAAPDQGDSIEISHKPSAAPDARC